jgi:hypothetical protein
MSATSHSQSPRLSARSPRATTWSGARRVQRLGHSRAHLRLLAPWHGPELDRQLAAGIDPHTSALLAMRARTITDKRGRKRVADGLTRALRTARPTTPGFTAAVRPRAAELLAVRPVVAALDRHLRCLEPVSAQGVAILRELLTEGASPLYQPSAPGALADRLCAAAAVLAPV